MPALNKHYPVLPVGYKPSESEQYMNPNQVEFFRLHLVQTRAMLQNEWESTHAEVNSSADTDSEEFDRATRDVILFSSVKRLESIQKSIEAIDLALEEIDCGRYGFCKRTGKKIGLQRLLATPEARFCIEEQEGIEMQDDVA